MRRRWFRPYREEPGEHATARPAPAEELEATFNRDGGGGHRRKVMRPDADGFSLPVDSDEDPPIAAFFDSPGEDD